MKYQSIYKYMEVYKKNITELVGSNAWKHITEKVAASSSLQLLFSYSPLSIAL